MKKNIYGLLFLLALGAFAPAEAQELGFAEGKANGWGFYLGNEFPGAHGNFAMIPGAGPDGTAAGRLEGYFRHGGMYTSISRTFQIPQAFREVKITLRNASLSEYMLVRLTDETSQTLQYRIALKPDYEEWQTVTVGPSSKPQTSWGGARNGKLNGKLRGIALLGEATALPSTSSPRSLLYFSGIEVVEQP